MNLLEEKIKKRINKELEIKKLDDGIKKLKKDLEEFNENRINIDSENIDEIIKDSNEIKRHNKEFKRLKKEFKNKEYRNKFDIELQWLEGELYDIIDLSKVIYV